MNEEFRIEVATIEHASGISETGRKAFLSAFINEKNRQEILAYLNEAFSEKAILAEFDAPGNVFLILTNDRGIIGFSRLVAESHENLPGDKPIKMERLYLNPDCIGKGHGTKLMRASIDYAKENGYDKMWLQVFEPNMKATEFYYRFGMKLFAYAPGKFESDQGRDLCLFCDLT